MFERFTDRARRVVVLAQEEARLLNHNYIGTEHLLLGLINEGGGVASKALVSLGISVEAVRAEVEDMIGRGSSPPSGHIPFTPRAKKVLELSLREALQLGHDYIGTEHILLGLLREDEGVGAQALVRLGANLNRARRAVVELLGASGGAEREPSAGEGPPLDPVTGMRSTPWQWEPPELRGARRRERLERIETLAREEAGAMGHTSIGAPHRWLGFVRMEIEQATADLEALERSLEEGRRLVAEQWSDLEGEIE